MNIKFGWIAGILAIFTGLTFAGGMQPAHADLTVDSGTLAGATVKGAVRYRNFNSAGGAEVYVHSPDVLSGDPPVCCTGANSDIDYNSGSGQRTITFEYDGVGTLKSVYQFGVTIVTTQETTVGDLGDLNYLAFETNSTQGGATRYVEIRNVVVSKGGTPFNPNPAISAMGAQQQLQQRYATGEILTGGFKVTAELNIVGSSHGGGDSHYVDIRVGHVPVDDDDAPIVSNVHVTPPMPLLYGSADVEANVDDTDRGNSTIASAQYQLNGGSWEEMDAQDGDFDDVSEDVFATLVYLDQIGLNTVCVRGEDEHGNLSGTDPDGNAGNDPCVDFIVGYGFDGFYSPVDNDLVNAAKAGQAIPFKWRLTDADGGPISDPDSFVAFYSYPVECDSLSGNIADSVEEYASGNSGLQYDGDGYWQFNWKTPKSYASTCRAAYVEFNSTQISPVVIFKFKK